MNANCAWSDAEIAAWQARNRVLVRGDGWNAWLLAVAGADPDACASMAATLIRGYWGNAIPLVGRRGGFRGEVLHLEIDPLRSLPTVGPGDSGLFPAGTALDALGPVVALGPTGPDMPTLDPPFRWVLVQFVLGPVPNDVLPWPVWDAMPAGFAVVPGSPLLWAPECPLLCDATAVAVFLPERAKPNPEDFVPPRIWGTSVDKVADAIADTAEVVLYVVGALVALVALRALR